MSPDFYLPNPIFFHLTNLTDDTVCGFHALISRRYLYKKYDFLLPTVVSSTPRSVFKNCFAVHGVHPHIQYLNKSNYPFKKEVITPRCYNYLCRWFRIWGDSQRKLRGVIVCVNERNKYQISPRNWIQIWKFFSMTIRGPDRFVKWHKQIGAKIWWYCPLKQKFF